MILDLTLWLTGLMLLAYWFNYVIGSPLSDSFDVRAILAQFPLGLADRRLASLGRLKDIKDEEKAELELTHGDRLFWQTVQDQRKARLEEAKNWFTWERSLLCPICLHWWLTATFGAICLTFDLLHARELWLWAGFIYLVNHLLIRKIA